MKRGNDIMKINQVATILNAINAEMCGETEISEVAEDLRNIVEVGTQLTTGNNDLTNFFEAYGKKLIDKVGRVVIVDRTYKSTAPDITRDSWEYGSIMEKIRVSANELADDITWSLNRGDAPEQYEYNPATMSAKYFDSLDTFMTQISLPEKTLKSAFTSAEAMGRLIAAIENRVAMKISISKDNLIRRTVNNLIAEKIAANKEINLLAMYNEGRATPITAAEALVSKDFLKFAVFNIMKYKKMIEEPSVLFGEEDYVNFTPSEYMKLIMLDTFVQSSEMYLESDTFHNDLVSLGSGYQTVPYWQGSGTDLEFGFDTISSINVKTASNGTAVNVTGVIGVLFDRDAAAVCIEDGEVTSKYAAKGRFYNYFHYWNARYMNDLAENVVVFTIRATE